MTDATVSARYLAQIFEHLQSLHDDEVPSIREAASMLAEHVKHDKIIYAFGPGGHSNLASQEVFFRAGGLMHVSAMLDEGTLLSGGALRSMAVERTPGYGKIVMDDYRLGEEDLLIIINAYGINSATIDAAMEARRRGVKTIGVTSVSHASRTPEDHAARHPSKKNLHDLVDVVVDSKVPIGDAVVEIDGIEQRVAAISTFANAYLLNTIVAETVQLLVEEGTSPPIWTSGNAPGGDEANSRFIDKFKGRIKKL